ncbi:MAG: adenylate/guanylate cyclase domain-containing protein [Candidatus Riflebacteria bacterium]|nr:adenylate/guanylate cyclase domain-containing protein [Candidatus Riflebacteria bacterium]
MFSQTDRPIYLLALLTNKRCFLILRDELKTSQAAILAFNLQQVQSVQLVRDAGNTSVEIETPQDIFCLPQMLPDDAYEASNMIREKSVNAIESQEEFIDRDFEKELKKLDMLFKAKAVKNSEYIFRKSRLQKMELEKFSDANIELLLAKRFSEGGSSDSFDEQLMKKFTFEKSVMFTDIVGFSSRAAQKMLLDTMTLLAVHDKLLVPIFKKYDGTLIKKIGDALMVRFDEPLKACNAAREMQAELSAFNQRSNEKIFIRIGINTGTVFVKNEDVFGEAVNIAARMENLAKPGRIFITETTMEKLAGKIPCADMGFHKIKGKDEPLRVYSIQDDSNADTMEKMAIEFMQETGIQPNEQPLKAPPSLMLPVSEISSNSGLPDIADMYAPAVDPHEQMLQAIDLARNSYIASVKQGRQRSPDLENWFARFEDLLRPQLSK